MQLAIVISVFRDHRPACPCGRQLLNLVDLTLNLRVEWDPVRVISPCVWIYNWGNSDCVQADRHKDVRYSAQLSVIRSVLAFKTPTQDSPGLCFICWLAVDKHDTLRVMSPSKIGGTCFPESLLGGEQPTHEGTLFWILSEKYASTQWDHHSCSLTFTTLLGLFAVCTTTCVCVS